MTDATVADTPEARRVPPPPPRLATLRTVGLYLAAFLVVPNLLIALLGTVVYLVRPPLNLDYALLAPAFAVAGAAGAGGLYGLLLAADLMQSILPAFHLSPRSAVESALAVSGLPPILTLGVVVLGGVAVSALAWFGCVVLRARAPRRSLVAAALVLAAAGGAAWTEDALQAPGPGGAAAVRTDVVTSALGFLYTGIRAGAHERGDDPWVEGVPAATDPLFAAVEAGEPLPARVVLVLVESLGLPVAPAIERLQRSALADPRVAARYRVTGDTVRFEGSTVPAELRELCRLGVSTVHPDPGRLPAGDCLPGLLDARGYRTVAVHGFSGVFFQRAAWYPGLGFDEVHLGGDVLRLTGSDARCGLVFVGACDGAVGDWLGRRLRAAPGPLFVYWLTLNAHSPAPAPDPTRTDLPCERYPDLEPDVCRLLGHHDLVLRGVVQAATAPGLPPTLFVVVGDHAPPFATRGSRRRFHAGTVPAFLLWPREARDG